MNPDPCCWSSFRLVFQGVLEVPNLRRRGARGLSALICEFDKGTVPLIRFPIHSQIPSTMGLASKAECLFFGAVLFKYLNVSMTGLSIFTPSFYSFRNSAPNNGAAKEAIRARMKPPRWFNRRFLVRGSVLGSITVLKASRCRSNNLFCLPFNPLPVCLGGIPVRFSFSFSKRSFHLRRILIKIPPKKPRPPGFMMTSIFWGMETVRSINRINTSRFLSTHFSCCLCNGLMFPSNKCFAAILNHFNKPNRAVPTLFSNSL